MLDKFIASLKKIDIKLNWFVNNKGKLEGPQIDLPAPFQGMCWSRSIESYVQLQQVLVHLDLLTFVHII